MGLPVEKIKSQSKFEFPIQFNIPGLLPNLELPQFIESNYCLRLIVGYKKGSTKIPIVELEVFN